LQFCLLGILDLLCVGTGNGGGYIIHLYCSLVNKIPSKFRGRAPSAHPPPPSPLWPGSIEGWGQISKPVLRQRSQCMVSQLRFFKKITEKVKLLKKLKCFFFKLTKIGYATLRLLGTTKRQFDIGSNHLVLVFATTMGLIIWSK
jgi:hypothetical protein